VIVRSFGPIFFPQAVHFSFSKNCGIPQRLFGQCIVSLAPQVSHFSWTKVLPPQTGHVMYSARPQPAQIA
jgi:hypothetical protein